MLMLLASICQSRIGPKHSKLECGAAGQWFPQRRERSPRGCFLQEPLMFSTDAQIQKSKTLNTFV